MLRPDSYPQSEGPSADHQFGSYKDETAVGANDGTGLFKDELMDLFQPWANLFTKHSITPSNVKEKQSVSQVTEALDAELTLTAGNVDTMTSNGTYAANSDNKNGILLLESPLTAVTIGVGGGINEGNRLTVINNTGGTVVVTAALAITVLDGEKLILFYDSDLPGWNFLLSDTIISGSLKNLQTNDATSTTTGTYLTQGGISSVKAMYAGGKITSESSDDATNKDAGAILAKNGGIAAERKIHAGESITSDIGTKRGTAGTVLREKIINIGDWDMDATTRVTVAHGLGAEWKKIRCISVIIRNDSDDSYSLLSNFTDAVDPDLLAGGIWGFDGTNIILERRASGKFDLTTHDSTSYNRGWIYILYEI